MPGGGAMTSEIAPWHVVGDKGAGALNGVPPRRALAANRSRVEFLNQVGAAGENGTLVDRALVGHLVGIERERFREEQGARHAVRAAGRPQGEVIQMPEAAAQRRAQQS